MPRTRLRIVTLVVAASIATVHARQTDPIDTPVLSPEAEMETFALPPGYHVELVASEPMISDAVLIDWDADGRLWAIEMPGYMLDIRATDEHLPTGRVVVLEDTDDDGRMDTRTVFADGLVLPRALKVLDRGVLVAEPPNLWLLRDIDGDFRADTRTVVTDTYGRPDANVEHNANGLMWALDNWMYTSEASTFLRLKNGAFEVRPTVSRGQWGVSQDDAGRVYRNTNSSALHVDLVPTYYYARHPGLLRTRGGYESLTGPNRELNVVWPARPTPGVNRGYQAGVLRPDGRLATFTAIAAPTVYRGDRLPAELAGNVFAAEPAGNLVTRIIVSDDGTSLSAAKAYPDTEFLTSTDERFRPVYLSSAPDGTLYVVDMYRGIIQYKGYITEYLRDYILPRNLEQPVALGRIFRVVHDTTRRGPRPALSGAVNDELIATLSHPNGWWRDTAQRLLVERGDVSVAPPLVALAAGAPDARTRLHALWTLDGLDRITAEAVTQALGDPSRDVRTSAVRLAERWLREGDAAIETAVRQRIADPDWAVRRQLAASLGELPPGTREAALATMLERHGNDPVVVDAALSGLHGSESLVLDRLLAVPDETAALSAAITMVTATIVRGGQDAAAQRVFASAAEAGRPRWQRSALVGGAEVALVGATMPGTPARRGGPPSVVAPCRTCPGGRAGPGGAPAFPAPRAGGARAANPPARGRAGGPMLRLEREPALVEFVARDAGELGRRAAAVLARVEWPGKPSASAQETPLTPVEQQRFAAGRETYLNICQACHLADGRGLDGVAPGLVGSELALGPVGLTARVLINGKEGDVGLMPPLGATLSDDQIADVLTYIRREWGHAAAPVDSAAVAAIRAQSAGRTLPWTTEELARVGAN